MSESENNQDLLCTGCKVDLSKCDHLEDCPILAKMKADELAKQTVKDNSGIILLNTLDIKADELAKQTAKDRENFEKDVKIALKNAKIEIEENNKKKITELQKELKKETDIMRKKNIIIDRLFKLESDTEISRDELLKFDLQQLAECYKQVLHTVNSEKTSELQFRVTCPLCLKSTGETRELGYTESQDEAVKVLNQHKKLEHKSSNHGWILLAVVSAMLAAGSIAAYKIYKKKKESKTE